MVNRSPSYVRTAALVLVCAGLMACAHAQAPAPANHDDARPVILTLGSSQVQLTVPAGWHAQQPQTHPDDAVTLALIGRDPAARLTVKVKPVSVELGLEALGKALQVALTAHPGFELTGSRLVLVSEIPVITLAGTLAENEHQLDVCVYVFRASGYLWEMVLTAPQAVGVSTDLLKEMVAALSVRPTPEDRWARLSCSQEVLLAYQDSHHLALAESGVGLPGVIIRDLDSCLNKVAIGTRLNAEKQLADEGQHFPANTSQLIIYLETNNAPSNTEITFQFASGEETIFQRRIRLSGSRKFAVTVSPRNRPSFPPGAYLCRVLVNDQMAWEVPTQIGN